jgi:anti-sigma regulatory factor (Ser/Thr protein kinase)
VSPRDARVVLRIPGNAAGLQAFRSTTRRWLAGASSDATEVDEITMAVNEGVQNAIEHGHRRRPTPVTVVLERHGEGLRITISDRGNWTEGASRDRGRGLPLMRALMDDVSVDTSGGGTVIVLRRQLTQPSPAPA